MPKNSLPITNRCHYDFSCLGILTFFCILSWFCFCILDFGCVFVLFCERENMKLGEYGDGEDLRGVARKENKIHIKNLD